MNELGPIVVALVILLIVVVSAIRGISKGGSGVGLGMQSDLDEWAAENKLTIVSFEPGMYSTSRVLFSMRSNQEFRITVRDQTGKVKSGLARCRRTGIRTTTVDVNWDV